jgi:hypothetical protein
MIKQRYQEYMGYIKYNNPQSAYAQHILNHKHDYGPIKKTTSLLKHSTTIHSYYPMNSLSSRLHNQLILEQNTGEHNPMYQLFIDTTHTSLPPTQTDQYLSN